MRYNAKGQAKREEICEKPDFSLLDKGNKGDYNKSL